MSNLARFNFLSPENMTIVATNDCDQSSGVILCDYKSLWKKNSKHNQCALALALGKNNFKFCYDDQISADPCLTEIVDSGLLISNIQKTSIIFNSDILAESSELERGQHFLPAKILRNKEVTIVCNSQVIPKFYFTDEKSYNFNLSVRHVAISTNPILNNTVKFDDFFQHPIIKRVLTTDKKRKIYVLLEKIILMCLIIIVALTILKNIITCVLRTSQSLTGLGKRRRKVKNHSH